jgi:hypothetical protein
MASGNTTTDALADSLPSVVAQARLVREQEGVMPQLVDKVTLGKGSGNDWREISLEQLTAQNITESTELDNPQQLVDSILTATPQVTGIQTLITDRVAARISKKAFAKLGPLAQNAIQRLKETDGLAVFAGATTDLGTAGNSAGSGIISAGVARIAADSTEPGNPPYRIVLHGHHIHDIYSELTTGMTTYPTPTGLSARVFSEGFKGNIGGGQVFNANQMSINSSDDATGGVFAKEAIVLVQGRAPRTETRREPHIGGGATSVFLYDEYIYVERSAGNWMYGLTFDATAPTA